MQGKQTFMVVVMFISCVQLQVTVSGATETGIIMLRMNEFHL